MLLIMRLLYLVTLLHVSLHGQFDVFSMDSSAVLQTHHVIEDERIIRLWISSSFSDFMSSIL